MPFTANYFLKINHESIVNYADVNKPYVLEKFIDEVVRFSEESSHVNLQMVW